MTQQLISHDELMPEIRRLTDSGHEVVIRAKGRSMHPTIRDGRDMLVVSPVDRSAVAVGDVLLVYTNDRRYVAHRVERIEGDTITLRGDGNIDGTEQCVRDGVIGRIDRIRRGDREIDLQSAGARRKAATVVPLLRTMRRYKSKLHPLKVLYKKLTGRK